VTSLYNLANPDNLVNTWLKKGLPEKLVKTATKAIKESIVKILSQEIEGELEKVIAESITQGKLLAAASYFNQGYPLEEIASRTRLSQDAIISAAAYLKAKKAENDEKAKEASECPLSSEAPPKTKPPKKTSERKTSERKTSERKTSPKKTSRNKGPARE
jgi:hypothetical protein